MISDGITSRIALIDAIENNMFNFSHLQKIALFTGD